MRSVADLAGAMCEAMGAPHAVAEADGGPREMRALAVDPGLAATALGWRGRIGAAEAVRLTADWYGAGRRGAAMERVTRDQIRAYAEAVA